MLRRTVGVRGDLTDLNLMLRRRGVGDDKLGAGRMFYGTQDFALLRLVPYKPSMYSVSNILQRILYKTYLVPYKPRG